MQQAIDALANIQLPADATAKVTELRQKLAPLAAHATQLVDANGRLRAELIVRDVAAMRDFPSADVVNVAELQTAVEQTAAANPNNAPLQQAAASARALSKAVAELSARFNGVVATLRERIDSIESWYDTVMQGFEERYSRHMRTWVFILRACEEIQRGRSYERRRTAARRADDGDAGTSQRRRNEADGLLPP